jgi:hypothetical protein
MLAKRLALTLRMGAIVFALSALALVAAPEFFLEFLKIAKEQSNFDEFYLEFPSDQECLSG